jgi:iron complex outermembrane receptor protein
VNRSPHNRAAVCLGLGLALPVTALAASTSDETNEIQLRPVVVLEQRVEAELEAEQALTPGGVTLLDGDTFYERNVSTLADMLRFVPGVWAASGQMGDATYFSSRGSNLDATNYDGNGIKLLQDGLPVTAADGSNHNRMIDPLSARYAVVARGANALTYGASTLGGAIDFITPTAHDTPSQVFLSGGSHGDVQGRVTAGAVDGAFDGLVTLEARHWDGFRDQQQQEREGLYANAGWQFSDSVRTRFYAAYIDNHQDLPGALTRDQWHDDPDQAQPEAVTGNYQYNVETWRVADKTVWDIDENSSLTFGLSYEDQKLYHPIVDKVMVDFDGPGPDLPTEVFSLLINTELKNAGVSLRYDLRLRDHDLLAGLNYGETTVKGGNYRNDAGHRNGLSTRVDNDADSLELFAMDRWQFAPQWTLVYGAQAVSAGREVRNTDTESGELRNPHGNYDSINPRAGAIYQLTPEAELFANVSRLYEAPTSYELDDDACACNDTLDAMHGTVVEVGSRGRMALGGANSWHWDSALYYAKLKDEILSKDDMNAPGTSLSTNIDKTVHAGLEALLGASFALDTAGTHRIEPLLNLTVNKFTFNNDPIYGNNDLPAAPGYFARGELLYRHAGGFYVGPTFDIVDKRYADFSNTYRVGSYTLLGLRTGFAAQTWEIYAELRNLADKEYISVFTVKDVAQADDAILNPGEPRSAYVGVKLQL